MTTQTDVTDADLYGPLADPWSFDLDTYLSAVPAELLAYPEGRRELTRTDPVLFALVYLPHHLRSEETGGLSLSPFHLDLCRQAIEWIRPLRNAAEHRDAYIAPRGAGKSTWLFLILPMWAAAHGHLKFIAAFADSTSQAEQHLMNFRHELETNDLLGADFPRLTQPLKGTKVARILANSRGQIQQDNGFTFMARGIDSAVAGMKVGATRPQLLILDDIEPDESNYSVHQMHKRLRTVTDNIFPLNVFARVLIAGTVTMSGSIIHQLVKHAKGETPDGTDQWITDENIRVHHYLAIITRDDGTEVSLWPQKWPLDHLQSIRHTRSFLKNYQNAPVATDGAYWSPDDIVHDDTHADFGNTLMWIDPATTTKTTSDYTGIAIASLTSGNTLPVRVRHVSAVRLVGDDLRTKVLELLTAYPETTVVIVESNQGGDHWQSILRGLPVKVRTVHSSTRKEVRIQQALVRYQRGQVVHTRRFPAVEEAMCAYPHVAHDDDVEAVSCAVNRLVENITPAKTQRRASARQRTYA